MTTPDATLAAIRAADAKAQDAWLTLADALTGCLHPDTDCTGHVLCNAAADYSHAADEVRDACMALVDVQQREIEALRARGRRER